MKASNSLRKPPLTVHDLIEAVQTHIVNHTNYTQKQASKLMSAFKSVANHLCSCLGKSPDRALTSEIANLGTRFGAYLKTCGLRPQRVLELTYNRNTLLRYAKELGCSSPLFVLEDEWEPIHRAMKNHRHTVGYQIVRFAIQRQIRLCDFSNAHLEAFVTEKKRIGNTYNTIKNTVWGFKSAIRAAGLENRLPLLDADSGRGETYSLPFSKMSPPLKKEVKQILAWLRARSAAGKLRMRQTTEEIVLLQLEQMLGYAENVRNLGRIVSLRQILTRRFIRSFIRWLNVDRGCRRSGIELKMRTLRSILTQHPSFRDHDYRWILDLVREIDPDEESQVKARRESREAPYETVAQIHGAIRRTRLRGRSLSRRAKARLVHDELLMRWLVVFPWYPRCLRECRIGFPSGNVFKAQVPAGSSSFKLTASAEMALGHNPLAKVWQFHFRATETPDGQEVRGLLPSTLVRLLEVYLRDYRPLLLGPVPTDKLFVNQTGGDLTSHQLRQCIGRLTTHYIGKWMTPTAFRAVFGRHWLEVHPGDYHTLGAILWLDFTYVKQLFDPNYREWGHAVRKRIAA